MPVPAGGNNTPPPGAYASIDDLTNAMTPKAAPANAAQLLVRASRDVDRALLCAIYDPTDAAIKTALNGATVEQVVYQLTQGNSDGVPTGTQSMTIGRVSVTRSQQAPASSVAGGVDLAPQAFSILQQAGLTGFGPITFWS